MKKLILIVLCCFALSSSYAQDTVKKTSHTGDFNEEYMVLKSNKKMRQGSYQLFYHKKPVAVGKYDQGKKAGVWSYYTDDKLVQQYDFTNNKMVLNEPEKDVVFDVAAVQGEKTTNPVVIGGLNSLRYMAACTNYAQSLSGFGGKVSVAHSINLDEDGKIIAWTTVIKSADDLKVVNPSFSNIPEDAVLITAGMVNGKKSGSVINFRDPDQTVEVKRVAATETKTETVTSRGRGRN